MRYSITTVDGTTHTDTLPADLSRVLTVVDTVNETRVALWPPVPEVHEKPAAAPVVTEADIAAAMKRLKLFVKETRTGKFSVYVGIQPRGSFDTRDAAEALVRRYALSALRTETRSMKTLSRIAQLDQRTALPDQCLHSAEADVRPPRRKSGFVPKPSSDVVKNCRTRRRLGSWLTLFSDNAPLDLSPLGSDHPNVSPSSQQT